MTQKKPPTPTPETDIEEAFGAAEDACAHLAEIIGEELEPAVAELAAADPSITCFDVDVRAALAVIDERVARVEVALRYVRRTLYAARQAAEAAD